MINDGDFGAVPEKISEQLKKVYISNERLIVLVRDLLNISRIESGKQEYNFQAVDLGQLAKEIVTNLSIIAKEKGLALKLLPSKAPKVVADISQFSITMLVVDSSSLSLRLSTRTVFTDLQHVSSMPHLELTRLSLVCLVCLVLVTQHSRWISL